MGSPTYTMARRGQESALQLDYHPESQILVHMSPASYLRHSATRYTPSEWQQETARLQVGITTTARQQLRLRMQEGQPLDALFLDADPFTGMVVGQEGMHRALIAQDLGIALLPVLVYARSRTLGLCSEAEAPGWKSRLRALFDEAPDLSRQVSALLGGALAGEPPLEF